MKKIILGLLLLLYMIFIFYMSHQDANVSSNLSNSFIDIITESNNNIITFIVRKSAHFILYFGLGIITFLNLNLYKLTNKKTIIISLLICFVYAMSDELHQTFIDGRSGEVRDVIIDTLGSLAGISLIYFITNMLFKKKKINKKNRLYLK